MRNDELRSRWNREALERENLDAVVCRLPENVLLLTGYWPPSSTAFAVLTRDGTSWLIAPHTEESQLPASVAHEVRIFPLGLIDSPHPLQSVQKILSEALKVLCIHHGRIGIELGFESVAPGQGAGEVSVPAALTRETLAAAGPDVTWVDGTPALIVARSRKTPDEVAHLRRAATIASFGLEAFRDHYRVGRTEAEVSAQVEAAITTRGVGFHGVRTARGWAQLMSGPPGAWAYSAHPASSARTIERGDLGVLELGTVADGYWSDLTRTLVAGGEPDARQAEMYDAILTAHANVRSEARAGMTGHEVDRLTRSVIEERGFGEYFVHKTGHGLGFRYHEAYPDLAPSNSGMIEEGMVSSIEPGLYVQGLGGMRLEENVIYTASGIELLAAFPTSLNGM